ncbi:MAG: hypothetical protein ACD_62C00348G0008 [uncultured bacterium]|nr:MAG: hypothetical protein ACD_62C00348G0008 [uncultured bacterium]
MGTIIDGKRVALKITDQVRSEVAVFVAQNGRVPGLATVLVGENPASQVYIKNKIQTAGKCGIQSFHHQLDVTITQKELLTLIEALNGNQEVDGILVQLPLPAHIDEAVVINAIDFGKDVDGFHPVNLGKLLMGSAGLFPCTPLGVMALCDEYQLSLEGKHVVVIGRSNIVGKPLSLMMQQKNATVTMAHSRTCDLPELCARADVLVVAVGRARMVQASWVKEGSVVIDVGMNRDDNGRLCGDVDFEAVKDKVAFITPVPGGVGPMTIAMLMKNTLNAAQHLIR